MMNNGVQQIFHALQNGANPHVIAAQIAQNNPVFRQALQMTNGRTPDQIYEIANRMARQRGLDINQIAQQIGIPLPK